MKIVESDTLVESLNVPRDSNSRRGISTPLRARTVVPSSSPEEGRRRAPEEFFVPFNIRR